MPLTYLAFRTAMWLAHNEGSELVPDDVCPSDELHDIGSELKNENYAVLEPSLGGLGLGLLDGKASQLRRKLRKYQRDTIGVRLLQWVDENPDRNIMLHTLARSELGEDFAGPLSEADFKAIASHLHEQKLIEADDYDGIMRAKVMPLGYQCLDSGYAPNDFMRQQGGTHTMTQHSTTVHGNVAGIQHGDNNTMTNYQQNTAALELLEQIRSLIPAGNTDAQALVTASEGQVHSSERSLPVMKALLTGVSTSVGGEVGRQIADLTKELLSLLF